MSSDYLSKIGSSLVRRCETRDPFRIADELGVEVLFCEDFGRLKGMYRVIKRNRFILLNKDLSDRMMRIVCAHVIEEAAISKEPEAEQLDLFTDYAEEEARRKAEETELERERTMQLAMLTIKKRYGKNAILKGMNFEEGATAKDRNSQIGGHKAWENSTVSVPQR